MTSLDDARQQVIDAARAIRHATNMEDGRYIELRDAVDALDAAEKPDPWELLRVANDRLREIAVGTFAVDGVRSDRTIDRIDAALAWHDAHPDA